MSKASTAQSSQTLQKQQKQSSLQTWGDAAHVVSLLSTSIFCVTVYRSLHAATDDDEASTSILDDDWKKQGFCIAHADEPYKTSHDVCFYVDTIFAIILAIVYLLYRHTPGLEHANPLIATAIPGILGHGIGHAAYGASLRNGTLDTNLLASQTGLQVFHDLMDQGYMAMVLGVIPILIFWTCLLRASLPNVSLVWIGISAVVAQVGIALVPGNFGFTYVQTVLMISFSLNQLARPCSEKENFSYAAYAVIVTVPVTLVGWLESTQCTRFVKEWLYGHVVYDAFIPVAVLFWYGVCYREAVVNAKDVAVKTKTL